MTKFTNDQIDFEWLKANAFNLRWAQVPEGVIPLTAADPDFPSAPQIAEAICRFAKNRYHPYSPPVGIQSFREAVSDHYLRRKKLALSPSMVLAVNSAAQGIDLVCKAVLQPGDEVLIFNPVDYLFKYNVESNLGKTISIPIHCDPEEPFPIESIESRITPRTKMICLCNPLNPTGKVFTHDELKSIAIIAKKHNLVILSDEIWSDIVFKPNHYTSIASIAGIELPEIYIVTGFSKSYALAGLRVGAVIAPSENAFKRILEVSRHESTVNGCSALSQVAATAALNECDDWLDSFVQHLQQMRDYCSLRIQRLEGWTSHNPQGCYVIFPNIQLTGMTSSEMHSLLLNKAKVSIVPGLPHWFGSGAEGYIRLSFATSQEVLQEAFDRIETTLKQL